MGTCCISKCIVRSCPQFHSNFDFPSVYHQFEALSNAFVETGTPSTFSISTVSTPFERLRVPSIVLATDFATPCKFLPFAIPLMALTEIAGA